MDENFTIEMTPLDGCDVKESGKYLVRTITSLKTVNYIYAHVLVNNHTVSVNVTNQTVTHISKEKIK